MPSGTQESQAAVECQLPLIELCWFYLQITSISGFLFPLPRNPSPFKPSILQQLPKRSPLVPCTLAPQTFLHRWRVSCLCSKKVRFLRATRWSPNSSLTLEPIPLQLKLHARPADLTLNSPDTSVSLCLCSVYPLCLEYLPFLSSKSTSNSASPPTASLKPTAGCDLRPCLFTWILFTESIPALWQ